MIIKGRWIGYYSFSNQEINKVRGFDKTIFQIDVLSIYGDTFNGTVQDDLGTGGMEGIGEITGIINGNKIEFVKQMPVMSLLNINNGDRKTVNKKHRPIYYTGEFSNNRKTVSGNWTFKFGFQWFGIIPIPVIPSKGIWSMSLEE